MLDCRGSQLPKSLFMFRFVCFFEKVKRRCESALLSRKARITGQNRPKPNPRDALVRFYVREAATTTPRPKNYIAILRVLKNHARHQRRALFCSIHCRSTASQRKVKAMSVSAAPSQDRTRHCYHVTRQLYCLHYSFRASSAPCQKPPTLPGATILGSGIHSQYLNQFSATFFAAK